MKLKRLAGSITSASAGCRPLVRRQPEGFFPFERERLVGGMATVYLAEDRKEGGK